MKQISTYSVSHSEKVTNSVVQVFDANIKFTIIFSRITNICKILEYIIIIITYKECNRKQQF